MADGDSNPSVTTALLHSETAAETKPVNGQGADAERTKSTVNSDSKKVYYDII